MRNYRALFFIVLSILLLAGCDGSGKDQAAAKPVESFYKAIVSQERDSIATIACAEWEREALREVDAFMGVKAELVDVTCTVKEVSGDSGSVTCAGKISASYGNETTDFPLEGRTHTVVNEQGEWRICGYSKQ